MKIFANKSILKKILIVFFIIFAISCIKPKTVKAASIGGELMEPICNFLVGIGDAVVRVVHDVVLKQEVSLIRIDLSNGWIGVLKKIAIIAAFVAAIVVIAIVTGGIGAGVAGISAAAGGTAAAGAAAAGAAATGWAAFWSTIVGNIGYVMVVGSLVGGWAAVKVANVSWWNNEVVLPLYSVTPEEIFKNNKDLPLFDVNFFEPNKGTVKYTVASYKIPEEIENGQYTNLLSGTKDVLSGIINNITSKESSIDSKMRDAIGMNIKEFQESAESITTTGENTNQANTTNCYYRQIGDNIYRLRERITNSVAGSIYYELEYMEGNLLNSITGEIHSGSYLLASVVKIWYYRIRMIAIVGMMSVLVYIGIRILLSSTSSQKAKYKELLGDWLVGILLLFTMHYIMFFANKFTVSLGNVLNNVAPHFYARYVYDKDGKIKEALDKAGFKEISAEGAKSKDASSENGYYITKEEDNIKYIEWDTNFMGAIRMDLQNTSIEDADKYLGYTIMFLVMVIYLVVFSWTYIKRLIYLAFLTMIAPLVALTYPIDKANDGRAQGFDYWFKEYIFNLLLQPMHLLIYTILISMSMELASTNWIYALVALGFIATAEKIVRAMFNFSKANTPGVFAGPAGAALTMAGMRWLFGHGPRGGKNDQSSGGTAKGGAGQGNSGIISSGKGLDLTKVLGAGDNSGSSANNRNQTDKSFMSEIIDSIPEGLTPEQEADFLRSNGLTDVDIAKLHEDTSLDNPTYFNDETEQFFTDGMDYTDEENAEILRNLGYDDVSINDKKKIGGFWHAARETAGAFGSGLTNKLVRNLEDAKPIRALGRLTAGTLGAATFGTVGLASGIAAGDLRSAVQNTVAAGAGGYKLGSGAFDFASNALTVEGLDEVAERAYYGDDKYREVIAKRNQMKKAHQEETIRAIQEKLNVSRGEAQKKAEEYAQKYMEHKITDVNDWLAAEKMQQQKAVDRNGRKRGRNYNLNEAIAAVKLDNSVGFEGKKEEDIKKIIGTMYPNLDVEASFNVLRDFNRVKKG